MQKISKGVPECLVTPLLMPLLLRIRITIPAYIDNVADAIKRACYDWFTFEQVSSPGANCTRQKKLNASPR